MADRCPNILFLFTDDQRFDTIGVLGNEHIRTPNLDALCESGVAFTHAGIMGSMSPAVCMPSRAQLMSGRTLFHAPHDLAGTPTFPEVFRAAGYATYGIGKWHNGPEAFSRSFSGGANIFFGGMSDHLAVPVQDFDPSGRYEKARECIGGKFSTELFSDSAIRFLQEYDGEAPFLLYTSYTAPHDPRTPPKQYAAMYHPGDVPLPGNLMPEHPFDNGEMRVRDEQLAPWPRTPEVIRQHIADYYGMISHVDENVGAILETLRDTGRFDDTIIVFAGDNGLAIGQHGLMGKQNMYEHSVRVPLVFSGPGIPQGRRTDALCYLLDIFPTLCDLTGIAAPGSVEGRSLAGIIRGDDDLVRDSLYFAYRDCQRAVRDDRYKLIEYSVGGTLTTQLFDILEDPLECTDLAGDSGHADRLNHLRSQLHQWQAGIDDPLAASCRR